MKNLGLILLTRLDAWLQATHAKFPVKDRDYNTAKRAAYLEKIQTTGQVNLEKINAGYLQPDFRPDKTW